MKLVTNILEELTALNVLPVLSMLMFIVFFGFLIWWVITSDKEKMKQNSMLPLEED